MLMIISYPRCCLFFLGLFLFLAPGDVAAQDKAKRKNVLFIASDAILATERFLLAPDAPQRAITGPAIWITYIAAQIAIVLGVLL